MNILCHLPPGANYGNQQGPEISLPATWSARYGVDSEAQADYLLQNTPAHAAYVDNGSARLRILSGDPFRSSVIMPGGEVFRLSSARWMESPLKQISSELPLQLLDALCNRPYSFGRMENVSTSDEGICYCYLDPRYRIIFDLHPDKTGKFFLASVVFPDVVYNHPELSSPPLRNEVQLANLVLSATTLIHIRKYVYKPNFKSSNKCSAKRDYGYELARMDNAHQETAKMRAEMQVHPKEKWGEIAYHVLVGHNCLELVFAAHFYISLLQGQAKPVFIGNSHTILGVGEVPEDLPVDMKEWPQDLAVCDPWANISCLARDYPDEFKNKMEKWTADGKRIFGLKNKGLISPNDPTWIQNVLEGEKALNIDTSPLAEI